MNDGVMCEAKDQLIWVQLSPSCSERGWKAEPRDAGVSMPSSAIRMFART